MRDALRRVLVAVLALVLVGVAPSTASADDGYDFLPGHPMFHTYGGTASGGYYGLCTGGYAITGTTGMYVLGARDCTTVISPVHGTDRAFGWPRYRGSTVLVELTPPDDAFQILVDPTTGQRPGTGYVQGYMPTADQAEGVLVGKMGAGSGWTEGPITGWIAYRGLVAICAAVATAPGDAGGPVWRWDEHGLRALGVIVAYDPATSHGCYLPIQGVLAEWGAWMTVFGPTVNVPDAGTLAPGLPQLDATPYTNPIQYIPIDPS